MANEDVADIILRPISFNYFEMLELYKPGSAREKVLEALESASESLGDVSTALAFAEFFANEEIGAALSGYGKHISEFAGHLSKPGTIIKNFQAAMKITEAITGLRGKISDNPQAAAKAFGKLFAGIGQLASYMPFPFSMYLEIFAGAEDFFVNLQKAIVPHTRGTNQRVNDAWAVSPDDEKPFDVP